MGNKRMWNIVKDLEAKGAKNLAQNLSRNRKEDQKRLEESGLPNWKEIIVDSQEFLRGEGGGRQFIINSPDKFFIAAIPKENAPENLERKYAFRLTSFEEAVIFVNEFLKGKNKEFYNIKLKNNTEVDMAGILIANKNSYFFEISYEDAVDKLNHGETSPEINGYYDGKNLCINNYKSLNLEKMNNQLLCFIKSSINLLEKQNIKKGYFEIIHPKKFEINGEVVFLNYLTNEAYLNIPSFNDSQNKKEEIQLSDFISRRIKEITEEEIRKKVKEIINKVL